MAITVYAEQKVEEFWDQIWTQQKIQGELHAVNVFHILKRLLEKNLDKNKKNLEAGCGLGRYLIYFTRQGYDMDGLDYSQPCIDALKKFDSSLQVKLGDVQELPYPDQSYDTYVSIGVLEHIKNGPQKALKEASRVIKPGGKLFITGPFFKQNMFGKLERILKPANFDPKGREFLEYHYTIKEMSKYIEQAGFKIKKTYYWGFKGQIWCHLPFLRHSQTKSKKNFFTVARTPGLDQQLNTVGRMLEKLVMIPPFSRLFALAWAIVAYKD